MQSHNNKHVPMRTCVATRVKKPKKELIRIVLNPTTQKLEIDAKGKLRARGANLDMTIEAFDIMVRKNVLKYALKLSKAPTKDEYVELRKQFIEAIEEKKFREGNKFVTIRVKKEDYEKISKIEN